MLRTFVSDTHDAAGRDLTERAHRGVRVVFGWGASERAAAELERLGAARVLVVTTAGRAEDVAGLRRALAERCVGTFTEAASHVPQSVVDRAVDAAERARADWVLAWGGGAAVGVAKAVALARPVRVAAVPTTYAGSERTDIWGVSGAEGKRTGRDPRVRPTLVVYDPALTLTLPRTLSLTSLLNALAHSVEALWSTAATPRALEAARDSLAPLWRALHGLSAPTAPEQEARDDALFAAALAGEALHGATMALHHKLAHVLGGLGTPHALTHSVLLPYTMATNGSVAPAAMAALREAWQVDDPPAALWRWMHASGLPTSLRGLPLAQGDLAWAARRATEQRYPNPRPLTEADYGALLTAAWRGDCPSLTHPPLGAPRSRP